MKIGKNLKPRKKGDYLNNSKEKAELSAQINFSLKNIIPTPISLILLG